MAVGCRSISEVAVEQLTLPPAPLARIKASSSLQPVSLAKIEAPDIYIKEISPFSFTFVSDFQNSQISLTALARQNLLLVFLFFKLLLGFLPLSLRRQWLVSFLLIGVTFFSFLSYAAFLSLLPRRLLGENFLHVEDSSFFFFFCLLCDDLMHSSGPAWAPVILSSFCTQNPFPWSVVLGR